MIFYITQREYGGFTIPIPIQNAYLRQYAEMKKIPYYLPISEVCYPNNYSVLYKALKSEINADNIVVMISVFQLPFDVVSEFDEFLMSNDRIRDIQVRTALEGLHGTLGVLWNKYKVINLLKSKVISNFSYKIKI